MQTSQTFSWRRVALGSHALPGKGCCGGILAWLSFALLLGLLRPGPVLGGAPGATNQIVAGTSGKTIKNSPAPPGSRNLALSVEDSVAVPASTNFSDMGSWIWETNTFDRQTVRFWKSFEIPRKSKITRARLRLTADNEYVLYLDGRELGRDAEWRHLYEYDITSLLKPGKHALAVEVYNSSREAGLVLGLRVGLAGGSVVDVKSDSSWFIVPAGVPGWEKRSEPSDSWRFATLICGFGSGPWGRLDYINLVPPFAPVVIHFWQTGWFEILLVTVCGVVSLLCFSLATQVVLHRKEGRLLQRERARIARDIHDDLGTRVTQLVLQGEVAQRELPADSPTRGQLERISEEAREALRAMDEILWAINPRRDNLHEFATFVCGHAQLFLKDTPIQCLLDVEPAMSTVAFDLPFRRSLLLAVKEALNNAAKHSQATELLLQIRRQGHGLTVAVRDNGRGFDLTQAKAGRNGLDNMIQRMNEVGGRCLLTSQPGQGCQVEFHIPLIQMRRRSWWWTWCQRRFLKPPPAGQDPLKN